jgi:hypothetical protein
MSFLNSATEFVIALFYFILTNAGVRPQKFCGPILNDPPSSQIP